MKWEEMMSNFIGMVFATLKKEGIDTSKMDTSEAIAKYNELKGGEGGSNAKGEETPKQEEKTAETGKETVKKTDAEKDSTVEKVAKKEAVENAGNNQLKDVESMTRIELAKELYQSYLKTGSKPIGSDKPLTEQQYVKRYLSGIGSSSGFSKQALQDLVQDARNGKYNGMDINKQNGASSTNTAEKMSTAMGISPDEAKAFVSGKGHLSNGGIEDKTDYSALKPTTYSNLQDDIWNKNYITEQMKTKQGDAQWQFIEDIMTMRHNQFEEFRKKNKNASYEDFVKTKSNLR